MGEFDEDGHYRTEFDLWMLGKVSIREAAKAAEKKPTIICRFTRWRSCTDAVKYGDIVRCKRAAGFCNFQMQEDAEK